MFFISELCIIQEFLGGCLQLLLDQYVKAKFGTCSSSVNFCRLRILWQLLLQFLLDQYDKAQLGTVSSSVNLVSFKNFMVAASAIFVGSVCQSTVGHRFFISELCILHKFFVGCPCNFCWISMPKHCWSHVLYQ